MSDSPLIYIDPPNDGYALRADVWVAVLCVCCGETPRNEGVLVGVGSVVSDSQYNTHRWFCKCGEKGNMLVPHEDDCPCTTHSDNACESESWLCSIAEKTV